jgi:hypothetical protein
MIKMLGFIVFGVAAVAVRRGNAQTYACVGATNEHAVALWDYAVRLTGGDSTLAGGTWSSTQPRGRVSSR